MSLSQINVSVARMAPYVSRMVLILSAILLARIGSRYIVDPVGALEPDGIIVQSAQAMTVARVGLGAFPLAIAVFAFGSVFVSRTLTATTSLIAVVMATALIVRVAGVVNSGVVGNPGPFIGEGVFLALSLVALAWNVASGSTTGHGPESVVEKSTSHDPGSELGT